MTFTPVDKFHAQLFTECPPGVELNVDYNADDIEDTRDICQQPKAQSKCAGYLEKWYFDKDQGKE